jgi:hypothetical protein
MIECECTICGTLFNLEEGEPFTEDCIACLEILDREHFLDSAEYDQED